MMPSKSVILHLVAILSGYQNTRAVSSTKQPNKVIKKKATVLQRYDLMIAATHMHT